MERGLIYEIAFDDQCFRFDLCRKTDQVFGQICLDHWWMPITRLYGQRQRNSPPAQNHRNAIRLYWAIVETNAATDERDAQERCLLASIVPNTRAEGSRTIFADAFLRAAPLPKRREQVESLDRLLQSGAEDRCSRQEFYQQSRELLGRVEYPAGIQAVYEHMSLELLEEGCGLLRDGDFPSALANVQTKWMRLMRTIGRRSGHRDEKSVLDVLSYEARAAFHDCYSVTWSALIPRLATEARQPQEAALFHRFWHTAVADSATRERFFHGHVLGLHPGTGPFMLTRTGPELIGNWLAQPTSDQAFGRLLHGILVGLFHYRERLDSARENRSQREQAVLDPVQAEEIREARRRGRWRI